MSNPPTTKTDTGIGHKTARGFFWLMGQGVADKIVTLIGQVALARLLTKEDFKLVALTYTVTTFATLLQQAGIGQVLIQRHGRFHLWSTSAFWMSLMIGLAAGLATAAAAPAVATFYNEPALRGLLFAAAITLPLNGLMTVPDAKLRAEMRFRFVAVVGLAGIVGTIGLSVVLAAFKYGAYSFILPPIAVTLARAGVMWWWARPRIRVRLQLRRWKYLVSDSTMLLVASIAMMATYQGGQIILGRVYPALAAAGVYYFAWNLSDQSLRLLVNNLSGVLFPALSTMHGDPSRQRMAYLRTTHMLLLIGLPICLWQAVLSGPLIRLVFSTRWQEAIPVMAALCVGMTARLVHGPSESMFLAQRRTAAYMRLTVGYAAAFIGIVAAACVIAGPDHAATGAAIGAGVSLGLLGPVSLFLAIRPLGGGLRETVRVYAVPVIAGIVSFTPGVLIGLATPRTVAGDVTAVLTTTLVCMGMYGGFLWVFAQRDLQDVLRRVGAVVRRGPRTRPGHCGTCGYDLSGTPTGVCPECGSAITTL